MMKVLRLVAEEHPTRGPHGILVRVECPESIDGLRFLADPTFLGWPMQPGDTLTIEQPDDGDNEALVVRREGCG